MINYERKLQEIESNEIQRINTLAFKEYNLFLQQAYFHEYIQDKNIEELIKSIDTSNFKTNEHLKLIHSLVIELAIESNDLIKLCDIKNKQLLHTESMSKIKNHDKNLKSFQSLQNQSECQIYYKLWADLICHVYYSILISKSTYAQSQISKRIEKTIIDLQTSIIQFIQNTNETLNDRKRENNKHNIIRTTMTL